MVDSYKTKAKLLVNQEYIEVIYLWDLKCSKCVYIVIKTDISTWLVLIKSWHFNTWQPWWNRTLRSNVYSDNRPLAPVCKHLKNAWTFNWAWEWYGSPQNVINTKMQLFNSSAANSFKLFIWKKKCIHHCIFNHRDEIEKRNAFGRVRGVMLFPELIRHCCPASPNIPQIDFEWIYF